MIRLKTKKKIIGLSFLLLVFLFLNFLDNRSEQKVLSGFETSKDNLLQLYFLDVGQGDATLIRTPEGNDILIDGGPDNTLIQKLGQYLPIWNRKLETVILTHPDGDHLIGLVEVLRRYEVERIFLTGVVDNSAVYQAFMAEINMKNIKVENIESKREIVLGEKVFLEILNPDKSFVAKSVESINNTSIAGKLVYASTTVMFTGDLEQEENLVQEGVDLKSTIYKVGHHGATNANDLSFVTAVDPEYAVISVGADNKFGHPTYRTLKNLEKVGAEIIRTDEAGDVVFFSDGEKIVISN